MRLLSLGLVILISLAAAIVWGVVVDGEPPVPRAKDLTTQVDAAWYESLPLDPDKATQAYLDRVPQDMRARGEAVSQTRYWVFTARIATLVLAASLFLFSGAASSLREIVSPRIAWKPAQDAVMAFAFLAVLFAITLPLDVYAGFVRARHFGFSEQPFSAFLQDTVINWLVMSTLYMIGAVAIYFVMRRRPASWAAWAGGIYSVLAMSYLVLLPVAIEPLFNTVRTLADGAQKEEILALARANDVPATDVYVSDASRQTRLLNAHVSGWGATTRITLDDNLLNEPFQPGVRWVLAHEIGHYVLGHTITIVISLSLVMLAGFLLIAWVGPRLVTTFGSRWGISDFRDTAAIPLFWFLFSLYGFLSLPVTNAISRLQEAQADLYGLNASDEPHGMAEFCIHDADTARLNPSSLDVLLFYDHPSDRARVEMAMRWRAARSSAP
jgi:STE24 endopeptidase